MSRVVAHGWVNRLCRNVEKLANRAVQARVAGASPVIPEFDRTPGLLPTHTVRQASGRFRLIFYSFQTFLNTAVQSKKLIVPVYRALQP